MSVPEEVKYPTCC